MNKFYFTFGSDECFPYQYGWVEVMADDLSQAVDKFNNRFGVRIEGVINCAFFYTEQEFKRTSMFVNGNGGIRCHEIIGVDTAQCTECERITLFTDEGGRCENEIGWLCVDCIVELERQGSALTFQDEEIIN